MQFEGTFCKSFFGKILSRKEEGMEYRECESFDEAVEQLSLCPVTLCPDGDGFVALSYDHLTSLLVQASISRAGPRQVIEASPCDLLVVPIPRPIEEIRPRLARIGKKKERRELVSIE